MNYNVLIVDDNDNNRFTMRTLLEENDINVFESANGSDALTTLIREKIQLIILDIQLPDYNGFELAKVIKNRKATKTIQIIFATAVFKTEEYISKGYKIGAVDYVLKPLNIDIFISKVNYYRSVYEEREQLLQAYALKNRSLEKVVRSLEKTKQRLLESENYWKQLGENIPDLVEVYSSENELLFRNHKVLENKLNLLYETYDSRIKEQVNITLDTGSSLKKIVEILEGDNSSYFQIRSIDIHNEEEHRCMLIVRDVTLEESYKNKE